MRAKRRRLTVKQAKLVRGIVKGKTVRDAARDAGYSGADETIRVEATRTLQKPPVAEALQRALEDQGLTLEALAAELKAGLTEGEKGSHDKYLTLAFRLRGDLNDRQPPATQNISAIIAIVRKSSEDRGLPL